jgi:hypothetical protein
MQDRKVELSTFSSFLTYLHLAPIDKTDKICAKLAIIA